MGKGNVPALFDVPTIFGPWAYACGACCKTYGNDNAAAIGCRIA
jgi:hypothetical protein